MEPFKPCRQRTEIEQIVCEATSNDWWGPSSYDIGRLKNLLTHPSSYQKVLTALWSRLEHRGKNWRHVYKTLKVMESLIQDGHQEVLSECYKNISVFRSLQHFSYVDGSKCDHGIVVRHKALEFMTFLMEITSSGALSVSAQCIFSQNTLWLKNVYLNFHYCVTPV
jgi:epsin